MTHSVDTPFPPPPPTETGAGSSTGDNSSQKKSDMAKDEARDVGHTAAQAGSQVASTAADQAKEVASETRHQAQDLVQQSRDQLRQQAVSQQQKAAEGLSGIAQQLRAMVEGNGAAPGPARDLVEQATSRVEDFAGWLQNREPADLLNEVRSFARRKPGTFLLGAAVAGVVAGRLTSGVKAAHSDSGGSQHGGSQGRTQANYVDQAPSYSGYGTTGAPGTTPVPPSPYGTLPPENSTVPPTTPAGWDDPARRPGQVG